MQTSHSNFEKIADAVKGSTVGMRNAEIIAGANINATEAQMRDLLKEMTEKGYLEHSGVCATTRYKLTPQGRLMFVANSALGQTEKTPAETLEPAPIVAESALTQIVDEQLSTLADLKYSDDPIARAMCSAKKSIDGFEERIFEDVERIEVTPYPQIEDFETRATQQHFFPELDDDSVFSPLHYNQGSIECIEALRACMSEEEYRGFCRGNVIKYLWRLNDKATPQENIKKARWYLDTLQESFE